MPLTPVFASREASRTGAFRASLAAGFVVVSLPVFLGVLNHDVAWWLYLSGRVLAGDRLYVDLIETNPPLNCWLNFAPILLSRMAGISEIQTLRLLMLGLIAGSLGLCARTLSLAFPERRGRRRLTLAFALFALIPAVGYDFAQREHLMLAMTLPALLMAAGRASGREYAGMYPWIVGTLAGVGIALKPHFAPAWLAVELTLAATRRDWRSMPRPEALAIVAVGMTYLGIVLGAYPEYLRMIAWARPLYEATGRVSFGSMLGQQATILSLVATLAFLLLRSKGDWRGVLLAADLGFLAVAFLQDKGYGYHFYPPLALALLLLGLLCAEGGSEANGRRIASKLCLAGVLAATVFGIMADRAAESICWRGRPVESDTPFGRMARVARDRADGGEIYAFSTALAATFPLVTYTEKRPASRHFSLWFLPALYPVTGEDAAISLRSKAEMGKAELMLFDSVVDDLIARKPMLLFVDETGPKPAFGGRRFDYLAYFSADPRFVAFLRDYEPIDKFDTFRAYRRKATPSRASLSLRTVR